MARIRLDFPDHLYRYATTMSVRSTDINAGNHLGNDALISMVSEARSRFLADTGIDETSPARGIIVTDVAAMYRAEAHVRDLLRFDVGFMDANQYGGDVIFRVTRPRDGALIALAKQGFVFYDYGAGKVMPMPDDVRERFPDA